MVTSLLRPRAPTTVEQVVGTRGHSRFACVYVLIGVCVCVLVCVLVCVMYVCVCACVSRFLIATVGELNTVYVGV